MKKALLRPYLFLQNGKLYWFDLRFTAQPIGKSREFPNQTSIK